LRETSEGQLKGKKILVSAGGTYEEIDAVRGITNRSSGKMGLEIAREAFIQGADVTMITGRMDVTIPKIIENISVESTEQMEDELKKLLPENDVFISAAAVSDFTVERSLNKKSDKISSGEYLTLQLKPLPKILNSVKQINPDIFLVGFKAEYNVSEEKLISLAHERIRTSGANFIVANDVSVEGAGFGSDKNQVIIVDGNTFTVPLTSKTEIGQKIITKIVENINKV
jgi:phosphopantothenoylcysteine decarboxylase/phosphopantothenate--cysteine ligase